MASKIVIVLCFALFAAAVAKSRYNDDQLDEINSRIAKCLQPLPAVPKGGIYRPSDDCRFRAGITPINEQRATKESVINPIIECLSKAGIQDGAAFETAKQCLKTQLSRPL
ncbi:uncharacterized protein LOC117639407 [Thrips palmi]|uniref:Uncharacterized protein LOC117639407 n=1 Tax=Thrips palmi TaxID=161013 RepID=A0A6P8Y3M0_THRPL|nr:uncharacterized protein LOC117639407 [Thrips palmi]